MKSVFWIYGQEVLLRMPAVWDRKDLCPPGKEEFRSKVSSCKAPPWGPVPFYIFLLREKVPLPYPVPSIDKWYPFQIPSLELCITFSCCKCTVLKLWINHKTDQEIVSTFSQPQNPSVSPFRSFCRPKWHRFPYPLIYFNHTWSLEKVPISQFGRRFPI